MGFDAGQLLSEDCLASSAMYGSWGIGIQLADISFVDKLSHTLRFAYYQGTNHSEFSSTNPLYMTTGDSAFEINVDSQYQVYDNLTGIVELGYIALSSDSERINRDDTLDKDAFRVSVGLKYTF